MDATLHLSADEILTVTDRIQNTDTGTEDQRVVPYRLLQKLGSAYLEMVPPRGLVDGELPVVFTEGELWLLRSKVTSADRGTTNDGLFGIRYLNKVYAAILSLDSPRIVPTAQPDDPDKAHVQAQLVRWAQEDEARTPEGLP